MKDGFLCRNVIVTRLPLPSLSKICHTRFHSAFYQDTIVLSPIFPLSHILIPEQSPLPRLFVIYNRCRITQLLELPRRHIMIRIMDGFPLQILELRHPISNVIAVWITLFRLGNRVEDTLYDQIVVLASSKALIYSRSMAGDLSRSFTSALVPITYQRPLTLAVHCHLDVSNAVVTLCPVYHSPAIVCCKISIDEALHKVLLA